MTDSPYFTTAEFRSLMPDMDEAKFPDARVETFRDAAEALIEQTCQTTFVERSRTATLDGDGSIGLVLPAAWVRSVTSASVDGTALTGYTYSVRGGVVMRVATGATVPTAWDCGVRNVSVTYVEGYSDAPPADLKLATMRYVRDLLLRLRDTSTVSVRTTSLATDTGTVSFAPSDPEHPTGIPDVDSVVMRYAALTGGFGFA